MLQEGAVEEAGGFAALGRADPRTACFCVAGEKQRIAGYFFPRNNFRRAGRRFVAVVGENESGGGGKVGDGTHLPDCQVAFRYISNFAKPILCKK